MAEGASSPHFAAEHDQAFAQRASRDGGPVLLGSKIATNGEQLTGAASVDSIDKHSYGLYGYGLYSYGP